MKKIKQNKEKQNPQLPLCRAFTHSPISSFIHTLIHQSLLLLKGKGTRHKGLTQLKIRERNYPTPRLKCGIFLQKLSVNSCNTHVSAFSICPLKINFSLKQTKNTYYWTNRFQFCIRTRTKNLRRNVGQEQIIEMRVTAFPTKLD